MRHPTNESALIRLAGPLETGDTAVLRKQAGQHLQIPPDHITINHQGAVLHSTKLRRKT